jgi:nitrite reductase/ring-hydroxylating ferredoxin subunit
MFAYRRRSTLLGRQQHRSTHTNGWQKCPHSSYPLASGVLFDIEDFGLLLSAGITCPKHGWSFDLFSGKSDRGNYKLKLWEVQLRPVAGGDGEVGEQEVWARKKQRIG